MRVVVVIGEDNDPAWLDALVSSTVGSAIDIGEDIAEGCLHKRVGVDL
jgi:hypothetical protein